MAEARQFTFDYNEVVEALLKKQGISEGIWGLFVEFKFGAGNLPTDANASELTPSALVGIKSIGVQRFEEHNNLTVDASKIVHLDGVRKGQGGGEKRKGRG